jgi:transposase
MHFLFCGEDGVMPRKFDQETKDKTVRLVLDHMRSYSSDWAAIRAVAERSGMAPETLRRWIRDSGKGQAPAPQPVDLAAENKALKKKAAELEQTIEIR